MPLYKNTLNFAVHLNNKAIHLLLLCSYMYIMCTEYVSLPVAPAVSFEHPTYSVDEHDGPVLLTMILSNPSSNDVTIKVFTTNGSATGNH